MRIKTEIYQDLHGRHWKITREGSDVIIEQAIEQPEASHNPVYDQQQDLHAPLKSEEDYKSYNQYADIEPGRKKPGSILNRKV